MDLSRPILAPLAIILFVSTSSACLVGTPSSLSPEPHTLATTQHARNLEQLTEGPSHDVDPSISRDGTQVAFANFDSFGARSHVDVFALLDRTRRRVTTDDVDARSPTWLSSTTLLYSSQKPGAEHTRATLLSLEALSTPRLLPAPYVNVNVASPSAFRSASSFRIVEEISQDVFGWYSATRYEYLEIVISDPDTLSMVKLDRGRWPSFSPDGRRIAYTGEGGRVIVADATNGERLYHLMPGDMPVFSPDGARLVFCATSAQGGVDLFVVPVGGGPVMQLTAGDGEACHPSWGPDHWIYFHANAKKSFDIWRLQWIDDADASPDTREIAASL